MNPATQEFLRICHRLYEREYVTATEGNVSMKLDDRRILCTPTGVCKGDLTENDLVTIDVEGRVVSGAKRPSTEIAMHLLFYRRRHDVRAVVHAHPVTATGFAAAALALDDCTLPEIIVDLGVVPLARYATPSTSEVPASLDPLIAAHNVILLQNHGVVAGGTSLLQAYHRMESVEHAARIILTARMLGGETVLSGEQVEKLKTASKANYGIDLEAKPASKTSCDISQSDTTQQSQATLQVSAIINKAINDLRLT